MVKAKRAKPAKKRSIVFRIISLIIIIICLLVLVFWNVDNFKNTQIQENLLSYIDVSTTDLNDIIPQYVDFVDIKNSDEASETTNNTSNTNGDEFSIIDVDFDKLKQINSSTVGFIFINNTNIQYPVVQADNNTYYLTHNFKNKYNRSGWIFADYTNNFDELDQNTIIYGHNRLTSNMFGDLNYLLNSSWYDNATNKYFDFSTQSTNYIAQIFAVYTIETEEVSITTNFSSTDAFYESIEYWENLSIYNFGVDVKADDNILTLYTCSNNTEYRIIVHARLIAT